MKAEGFYVQMINIDEGLSQARKGDISLSITDTESVVQIETGAEDAGFVKNSVYEVFLGLEDLMQSMQQNCDPLTPSFLEPEEVGRTSPDVLNLFTPSVISMNLKATTKDKLLKVVITYNAYKYIVWCLRCCLDKASW